MESLLFCGSNDQSASSAKSYPKVSANEAQISNTTFLSAELQDRHSSPLASLALRRSEMSGVGSENA